MAGEGEENHLMVWPYFERIPRDKNSLLNLILWKYDHKE